MSTMYKQLTQNYPIISKQISRPALEVVLRELETLLDGQLDGAVVEFGCYVGTTSLFIRRLLTIASDNRQFWAYDSFDGLPNKSPQDQSRAGEQFKTGELSVTKKQFLQEFKKAHLQPPVTIKNWFNALHTEQLPERIVYAFLDGDFYDSILTSLQLVWPRLSSGGTITIDDYGREALPGVERAVHDYFGGHPPSLHHEHNIAIIKKL
jgi:O-methyltransferase